MTENKFSIALLEKYWISENDTQTDLCAHGQLKVIIGNETCRPQCHRERLGKCSI